MKKIFIIFVTPLLVLSQEKYVKNDYVKINTKVKLENYVIDYSFKDHESILHHINFFFNKQESTSPSSTQDTR